MRGETVGNLAQELTSFVGRQRELTEAKRRLAASRLVTLVGVGGVGKTRLALRVAAAARRSFSAGVWLVELDQIQDDGLVASTVARTLGLRQQPGLAPDSMLSEYLAEARMLLVLDNCEHLVDGVAKLVETLLRDTSELRILATSRQALNVEGEAVLPVAPLTVPDPRRPMGTEELAEYEAVALFTERAAMVVPGFELTAAHQVAVGEICSRLEGLPLAIELAVARLRVLTPEQICDRLTDRALLTRGRRGAPERQRTLTASIEWSFALCTPPEQHVWAGLSVFVGGCELDAADTVFDSDAVPADLVPEILASLADKSILSVEEYAFGTRYRMLETVRQYAAATLHSAGRYVAARRRHADWYEDLVHRLNREWISDRQEYWLVRMPLEFPNLRTALETRLTLGDGEAALRILVAIPPAYLWARDLLGETRRWLTRALALTTEPGPTRARGLVLAAQLAIAQGELPAATSLLAEGRELARRTADAAALAFAGYAAGTLATSSGDPAAALPHYAEALELCAALPTLNQRLDLLLAHAVAAGLAGDEQRALACHQEIVAITEPVGERFNRANSLWALGLAAGQLGDGSRAVDLQRQALRLKWQIDDRLGVATSVEALAWATAPDDPERAATILGGLAALSRTTRTAVDASQHQFADARAACLRSTREALGHARFAAAMERGRRMSPDRVVAYCLGVRRAELLEASASPPPPAGDPLTELTRREREIAELVANGLSNKEIAAALVLSRRTVEGHVGRILAKHGFTSRAQIATLVIGRERGSAQGRSDPDIEPD
jgi:predicted ATPase/DNA-binding CsgD family transcriptional regulator